MAKRKPADEPTAPADDTTEAGSALGSLPEAPPAEGAAPSADEVAAELGLADVTDLYGAERAAQASVCNLPDPGTEWPIELRQALVRRVAVAAEHGPRSGSRDPEVRRLEETHSKRGAANRAEPT